MAQNKGDSYADIPNYIRYYVESTERGHIIKILTETGLKTFNCKWADYKRPKPLTKTKT
jgi:hypothetical protein